MSTPPRRLGLIGFGFIGAGVYRRVVAEPQWGLEIAFVHNRSRARLDALAAEHVLDRLEDCAACEPDLVVEVAHPDFTRRYGEAILAHADYLPLSVTALADDAWRERLVAAARAAGRRLLLPHGALVGCDNLIEWRHMFTGWITSRSRAGHSAQRGGCERRSQQANTLVHSAVPSPCDEPGF